MRARVLTRQQYGRDHAQVGSFFAYGPLWRRPWHLVWRVLVAWSIAIAISNALVLWRMPAPRPSAVGLDASFVIGLFFCDVFRYRRWRLNAPADKHFTQQ